MRTWLLVVLCVAVPALAVADEGTARAWHETWLLEALGVGVALVIAVLLWIVRKIMAAFIHLVVLFVAALFLLLAVFGRPMGVYDTLLGTEYSDPEVSIFPFVLDYMGGDDDASVDEPEGYSPEQPSFEEFYPDLD